MRLEQKPFRTTPRPTSIYVQPSVPPLNELEGQFHVHFLSKFTVRDQFIIAAVARAPVNRPGSERSALIIIGVDEKRDRYRCSANGCAARAARRRGPVAESIEPVHGKDHPSP